MKQFITWVTSITLTLVIVLFATFAAIILTFNMAACGALRQVTSAPSTPAAIGVVLSDAQWGISAAHDQLWLSDEEFAYATEAVQAADDALLASSNGTAVAVKVVLQDAEQLLPTGSKLRPYFDAAIILL